MAGENDVLIVVSTESSTALTDLKATEQAIEGITGAQEDLNEQLQQGTISQEEYLESKQRLDTALKKEQENRKHLDGIVKAESGTIDQQKQKIKELTAQRAKLDVSTEEGAEKHKKLTSQIGALNQSVDKAKKGTFDFGGTVDGLGGALDQFGVGASGAIDKVKGLTKASLTFLATPVGAILAAIVVVLGTLAAYFKNTGDGADKFAKIMAQLGSIMDVLIDRVSAFGRGVFNILTGNFKEGFDQIKESVKGVGDEMANDVKIAGELAEEIDRLEDAEKDYNVQASRTRNEIKLLEMQSKDRTKTEKERAAFLQKALDKEMEQNKALTKIRQDQLQAAADEAARRANIQQGANETLDDFAARLVANELLQDDLRDKVRDGIKALNEAEGESLTFQEKLQGERNKILDEAAKRRQKDAADELKLLAQLNKDKNAEMLRADQTAKIEELERQAAHDAIKAKAADEMAKTATGIVVTYQQTVKDSQDAITGYQKYSAGIRALVESELFKEISAAFNATADLAQSVFDGITKEREEQAKQQIATIELQKQAELALIEGEYEAEIAALDAKFKAGEISEVEYNEKRKLLDTQYKDSKNRIEQQAAYDQEQIKKAAFESNRKIRIADATLDMIQAALGAFSAMSRVPFVGPVLGPLAAAAALVFGKKQIDAIKNEQFVGSGIQPPAPLPPSDLSVPGTNLSTPIDGGLVNTNAAEPVNNKLGGPAPIINAKVSVVEINEAQESLKTKVAVAETV